MDHAKEEKVSILYSVAVVLAALLYSDLVILLLSKHLFGLTFPVVLALCVLYDAAFVYRIALNTK